MGTVKKAMRAGFFLLITPNSVMRKRIAPKAPAIPGAIAQAANTWETPFQPQLTPSVPRAAIPTPITPPMIECLVSS